MDFADIGPLQLVAVGFGPDANFQGLVLDELERLSTRGLIRVIDLQFVHKSDDGSLGALQMTELDDEELAAFGSVIGGLIDPEAADAASGTAAAALDPASAGQLFGMGPADVAALAEGLEPGESLGLLLFEHVWATELKAAIRETGGYPIAQGFLTPEALLAVGAEVQAIAEAEATVELAEAVAGAAMLDAAAAVETAEQVETAAAVEAVRALVAAQLVADTAIDEALDALVVAGLVEEATLDAAADAVEAAIAETNEAMEALEATEPG